MQHFGLLLEGAVCPRGQTGECAKLGVGICPLWVKASPGGEAGSPQGLTDEVEAGDYHIGWYYTVTFDLIRSGLSRTTIVEV